MHYKRHLVIGVMLVLLSVKPCAAEQALTVTLEAAEGPAFVTVRV